MAAGAFQSYFYHISSITQNYGVVGLGLGMFFESLGIPFASTLVALTAGTLIAAGKTTFWEALLITTTGLTLGSLVSYYIGYWGGNLGRFLTRTQSACEKNRLVEQYKKWGELTIFVAQLFGTTRTWVSLPAGAMKIRIQKFILYTALGGAIYCALAIGFSMLLAGILGRIISTVHSSLYLSLFIMSLLAVSVSAAVYYRRRTRCKEKENK